MLNINYINDVLCGIVCSTMFMQRWYLLNWLFKYRLIVWLNFIFLFFIFIFIFYYCTADLSKNFELFSLFNFQVQQPKNWVGSILRFVCSSRGIDSKFLW